MDWACSSIHHDGFAKGLHCGFGFCIRIDMTSIHSFSIIGTNKRTEHFVSDAVTGSEECGVSVGIPRSGQLIISRGAVRFSTLRTVGGKYSIIFHLGRGS